MLTEDEALALTLSLLMARENALAQTTPAFLLFSTDLQFLFKYE